MQRFLTSVCLSLVGLATLMVVGLSFAPTTYAASLHPSRTLTGGPCDPKYPENTGVSYDANSYITNHHDDGTAFGYFSFVNSNAPAIGAVQCPFSDLGILALNVGNIDADFYNVRATVNGATTQFTPASSYVFKGFGGNYTEIELYGFNFAIATNHQYTFQVQSCMFVAPSVPSCSAWSPSLVLTTSANEYCKSGYVWRAATPWDLVCVTPDQRTQVANDNSQANARVNPNGAYGPHTCISGYVWRNAFGGDYVCVTPSERTQVANDNSQALNRFVAP